MKRPVCEDGPIQSKYAVMAELADAQDLGSCGKLRAGSIPVNRTSESLRKQAFLVLRSGIEPEKAFGLYILYTRANYVKLYNICNPYMI